MRIPNQISYNLLLLWITSSAFAASSWTFDDAIVTVLSKKAGGAAVKEKFAPDKLLSKSIILGPSDTLKVLVTTKEDRKAKQPHQAFLNVKDPASKLETSYAIAIKDNGKGKVELTQKELPSQFLSSSAPLSISLIIASFGSSTPYHNHAFDLVLDLDPSSRIAAAGEKPTRYGKLIEIHHTFKEDPRSPPKIITLIFTAAVVTTLPILAITWLSLGANFNHLPKAFGKSPISHSLFFSSIIAMEAVFFLYYTSWNLFQTLPVIATIGLVTFLSGSRALREVQERRLSGLR